MSETFVIVGAVAKAARRFPDRGIDGQMLLLGQERQRPESARRLPRALRS